MNNLREDCQFINKTLMGVSEEGETDRSPILILNYQILGLGSIANEGEYHLPLKIHREINRSPLDFDNLT
jgi:hypothetical protein